MNESDDETLDRKAVQRAFERVADSHDPAADLERDTADELLERLQAVRVRPDRVVDLGCGTGYATRALQARYRRAEVLGVDFAPGMARRARGGLRLARRPLAACADMARLPLADASVDIVFSNLALPWVDDPVAFFGEVRRVLRPDGALMFSSFGPDTLVELREAWTGVDNAIHVRRFPDMHDIGDAMLGAGLVDPVMDVERRVHDYVDLRSLLRSLKGAGAHNAARGRPRGLTGRARFERLRRLYPKGSGEGVQATWELVFGHAWGAQIPRPGSGTAREFHVPLESIGRARPKKP